MKRNNNRLALPPGEGKAALQCKIISKILPMFLAALILCGCAQEVPPEPAVPETTAAIAATSPAGLYAPSPMETKTNGAVKAYPLGLSDAQALQIFADGVLVFSGEEVTELTLLSGEPLTVAASTRLDVLLSHQDPSLQIWDRTLSYFDSVTRETVVLDGSLAPVSRIAAPEGLSGVPLLSQDRNTLYYCTAKALMAWDLETGIHRTVKEMVYPGQSVVGLHQQDTILQCISENGYVFLNCTTGQQVKQWAGGLQLLSREEAFFASFSLGFETALVFGTGEDAQLLLPLAVGDAFFLPQSKALITGYQSSEEEVRLDCYDLESGKRKSRLALDSGAFPTAITGSGSFVWILTEDAPFGCDTIYRWEVSQMPIHDEGIYTAPYFSEPKEADWTACHALAEELSALHGIEILVGREAAAVQPWDYCLAPETQPAIILRELERLRQRLAHFPDQVLKTSAEDFSALKLCLVRSVRGSAESGSVSQATGVQFLEGTASHVAIATGRFGEQALYHELFHMLETHILVSSAAFDRWDELNPTGFQYDYSYLSNATRDSGIYLQGPQRSFIDTYSMSFPKEDRARVFEYAMLAGCDSLFEGEPMQAKLAAICQGLREAYGLEDVQETFRWEQYLRN